MPNEKQDFVVLIATSDRERVFKTLKSLEKCHKPASFDRLIIVENGPNETSGMPLDRFKSRIDGEYLYVPKANKSAALNHALQQLNDKFIFFTDDDIRLDPDILLHYEKTRGTHGKGHFFGGALGVDYETHPPSWMLDYLPESARGRRKEECSDKSSFLGCNWAAYSEDLKAIGGFDESRGPGTRLTGQETEAQKRLRDHGCRPIPVPDAMVWHLVPEHVFTQQWMIRRAERHGANNGLLKRNNNGSRLVNLYYSSNLLLFPSLAKSWVMKNLLKNEIQGSFKYRYLQSYRKGFYREWSGK